MKIEIDEQEVYNMMAKVILEDYIHLRDNVRYYSGDKAKLLEAYLTVIEYTTTAEQRAEVCL